MAKITIQGMGLFSKKLDQLVNDISHINNLALYDAAAIARDAIVSALESMPTHDDDEWGTANYKLYGATASEKPQLIEAFGVATFRHTTASVNTSLGFTGYVETPSSRFGDMVPAGMLMQCIEYGTSFRHGTHTISNAVKNIKARCEQAAQARIDQEIQKIGL